MIIRKIFYNELNLSKRFADAIFKLKKLCREYLKAKKITNLVRFIRNNAQKM